MNFKIYFVGSLVLTHSSFSFTCRFKSYSYLSMLLPSLHFTPSNIPIHNYLFSFNGALIQILEWLMNRQWRCHISELNTFQCLLFNPKRKTVPVNIQDSQLCKFEDIHWVMFWLALDEGLHSLLCPRSPALISLFDDLISVLSFVSIYASLLLYFSSGKQTVELVRWTLSAVETFFWRKEQAVGNILGTFAAGYTLYQGWGTLVPWETYPACFRSLLNPTLLIKLFVIVSGLYWACWWADHLNKLVSSQN